MTKTISLFPPTDQDTTALIVDAAWQFAYSALWHEQAFNAAELKRAKEHLRTYFSTGTDSRQLFIAFCERVLLANRYLTGEQSRYVPQPSIWLNRSYAYGFTGTRGWHDKLLARQQQVKGYQEGITAVANGYWQYIAAPSTKAFAACRKKLLQLREYGLLQIFYNAVIYNSFLTA